MLPMTQTNTPPLYEEERTLPEAYRQVVLALRYIDGQCDGAVDRDGRGFNAAHRQPGHDFACLYQRRGAHLTPNQLDYGYKIAVVYTRQLAEAGLSLPGIQAVQAAKEVLRYREEQRRAAVAAAQAQLAEVATAPGARPGAAPGAQIDVRGATLIITFFDYNKALVARMHRLQEVREHLAQRDRDLGRVQFSSHPAPHWEAPVAMLAQVIEALPGLARTPEVQALVAEAEAEARRVEQLANARERANRERIQAIATALGSLKAPLKNGRVLYQHQREAIVAIARWGSAILGHDMGLGKSITAAVLAKAYHEAFGARVIVVGPKSLRINWLREAASIGLAAIEYYTYERMPCVEDMRGSIYGDVPYVLFIDEAHALQTMQAKRTKKAIPLAWGALSTVAITGTPIKNGRPINIYPLLLCCKHELVYAETPNGEPDHDEIRRRKSDYMRRFCSSDETPVVVDGRPIIDAKGARQLDQLHRMIVGSPRGVLRKRKVQCIDLPKKIRKFVPIDMHSQAREAYYVDLDAMWEAYERRLQARVEAYKRDEWEVEVQKRLAAHIEANGAPDTEEKLTKLYEWLRQSTLDDAIERLNSGEALVGLNNLRQCGSRAKIAPTVEMLQSILEQDAIDAAEAAIEKRPHKQAAFVIFSAFVETAKAVANAARGLGLNVGVITGETKDVERQGAVDEFQAGTRRVLSCVYGAGGVGLTMTAATHVILLDRPWTPGDAEQAEDRGHRIGLTEDILALWMQIPESVSTADSKVDGILLTKQERVLKTLDGDLDNLPPDILFKNIAGTLLKDVMAARRAGANAKKHDD